MSLDTCVAEALNAKIITREMADTLLSQRGIDEQEVIEAALSDAYLKRRQAAIQLVKQQDALEHAEKFTRRKLGKSIKKALKGDTTGVTETDFLAGIDSLVTRDMYSQTGELNIASLTKYHSGVFDSRMTDVLQKHKSRWFGLATQKQKEGLRDLIKAMYGDSGKAEYTKMANDMAGVFEEARIKFNKAGGAIRKLDNYMPQSHNALKMVKYPNDLEQSKKEWVSFMLNDIKVAKLKDDNGNVLPDDRQLEELGKIFDTITNQGLNKKEAGQTTGVGKLANKYQAQRVLHFEDAESWLAYHERYGSDDILAGLTGYLTGMAKDIAAMEVMGANPALTHRFLIDHAQKRGASDVSLSFSEGTFKKQTGYSNDRQDIELAQLSGEVKALTTASLLGSAMLSSVGDPVMTALTAKYNGLPATKMVARFIKNLFDQENTTEIATDLGFIANEAKGRLLSLTQLNGDGQIGTGIGSRLSEFVMRSSGLSGWTETLRHTYSLEAARAYGKAAQTSYDALEPNMRKQFEKYGITADDWAKVKDITLTGNNKGKFLTGQDIVDQTGDELLARKYQTLILQEAELAALTPDSKARNLATLNQHSGTVGGELLSHTMAFKSFPITMLLTHVSRGLQAESRKGAAGYMFGLVAGTTIIGALALQLKELEKGRQPRNMSDKAFWQHAMMQGGGLGLFGDFILADNSRYGTSLAGSLGGASISIAEGALRSGAKAYEHIAEISDGKDAGTQLGKAFAEATEFTKKYNPIDTWQTRLIFERGLFEPLGTFADPSLEHRLKQKERKQRQDFGNGMLLPRGRGLQDVEMGRSVDK